jgi:hypothetical protein
MSLLALKLAPISFGIYLLHPLLIGCWEISLRRMGCGVSPGNDAMVCMLTLGSTIGLLLLPRAKTLWRWVRVQAA